MNKGTTNEMIKMDVHAGNYKTIKVQAHAKMELQKHISMVG